MSQLSLVALEFLHGAVVFSTSVAHNSSKCFCWIRSQVTHMECQNKESSRRGLTGWPAGLTLGKHLSPATRHASVQWLHNVLMLCVCALLIQYTSVQYEASAGRTMSSIYSFNKHWYCSISVSLTPSQASLSALWLKTQYPTWNTDQQNSDH